MAEAHLPSFPTFNVHEDSNVAVRWRRWISRFDNMLVAANIVEPVRRKAMLLHCGGEEIMDIYEGFELPAPAAADGGGDEPPNVYEILKTALNQHFTPQVNTEYELYKFRDCKQTSSENVETYANRLRKQAKLCNFHDIDRELKSQIIMGCMSSILRRRALRERNLTLQELLEIARNMEVAESQAKSIEDKDTVNKIYASHGGSRGREIQRNIPSRGGEHRQSEEQNERG